MAILSENVNKLRRSSYEAGVAAMRYAAMKKLASLGFIEEATMVAEITYDEVRALADAMIDSSDPEERDA